MAKWMKVDCMMCDKKDCDGIRGVKGAVCLDCVEMLRMIVEVEPREEVNGD